MMGGCKPAGNQHNGQAFVSEVLKVWGSDLVSHVLFFSLDDDSCSERSQLRGGGESECVCG